MNSLPQPAQPLPPTEPLFCPACGAGLQRRFESAVMIVRRFDCGAHWQTINAAGYWPTPCPNAFEQARKLRQLVESINAEAAHVWEGTGRKATFALWVMQKVYKAIGLLQPTDPPPADGQPTGPAPAPAPAVAPTTGEG